MIATVRRARGLNGEVKLPGDKSISHRALMFGAIASGTSRVRGLEYVAPVASAQVKSAVLLAGLFAEGETTVIEPVPTRDHTERMLRAMGVQVRSANGAVSVAPPARLSPLDIQIPGDMSAASFWLVAGGLVNGSRRRMPHIGVNP